MLWIFPAFCMTSVGAAPRIKNIKIAISNPADHVQMAVDIVIPIAQIRKVAPDFTPGAMIVTASDAGTLEEDASALQTEELPSQADDLDGDGKADELAFQIDLAPHQTRIVTLSYGDQGRIWRLRGDYQQRTAALFSRKIEGLGWESERLAFRVYFDPRNAIDLYGKRRPTLQLGMYASPDYTYHDESPEGRDIYKVGDAIGIGSVAAMVDGKTIKVAEVKERKWRIVASGPVRTVVELEYDGWNAGGKIIDLRSLSPFDWEAIAATVRKTNRVIVAHEDMLSWGYGAEIAALISDKLFDELDAPVRRVAAMDTFCAYQPTLEDEILPRRSSALSSTTAEDDEDAEELPVDKTKSSVPTDFEWHGGGEKVYVTGTIFQWSRKSKLYPV